MNKFSLKSKFICFIAGLLSTFAMQLPAHAQDKACLMEGSFTFMKQKLDIKDCLENNGVPQEQFLQTCKGISSAAESLGAPPAKITYLPSCPAPAQASCKGFFGSAMTSYYYKRDAQLLETSKQGCVAQGGKWSDENSNTSTKPKKK
jgi:hypothetical protein